MQIQQLNSNHNPFFKGISLSQYIQNVNCPEVQDQIQQYEDSNDLYINSQPRQQNILNCAIKQIDEDNYDDNVQYQDLIIQPIQKFDLHRARVLQNESVNKIRNNPLKKIQLHKFRNQSNPNKETSPKKQMFRSLYGHSFLPDKNESKLLSTLGMNNWKGKNKLKKQIEQKDKNKRQYNQVIRYQNVINQRLDNRLNSIRIDGVKDKIYQRTEKNNKKS